MTAILGGGISGLSAAYYCLENPRIGSTILFEASNRLGGWIKSTSSPTGVIFEEGPRTVRPFGPAGENTLKLVDSLNLNGKVIPINSSHPAAKNRLIYANKKLHLLPNSFSSLFKVNTPFERRLISVLWNEITASKVQKEDESIYSFVERRLGKDVADYLISPMICGICAGDAKKISVNFLLKPAFELEQKYGSIVKGMLLKTFNSPKSSQKTENDNNKSTLAHRAKEENWSVWGLQGGLQQLPIALENKLLSNNQVKINKNSVCEQITFKPGQVEMLINGKTEKYCKLISSLSAKYLAPLVERQHPQLSRELLAIPSTTVAVVNLHYEGKVLPLEAFGFLVPPKENSPILGVIFDSCVFKNSNTVLTVMMGGAWFDKFFADNNTNEHFLSVAVNETKKILGIKDDPIEHNVSVLKDCIPQYVVGHVQRLKRIESYISAHKLPMALCGSSFHGVGINDVILSAKQAVSQIA
ncbi:hypothetical protein TKK_0017767 [Trichogramma kaykai]|uniref:Protoporphyrinogen oxidase n=1 Tax=Trichogramma kaykai TaxID=54128 RepID=A0ABD2W1I1_9HYME